MINKDAGLLERGQDIRHMGANIIIADFFDAGTISFQYVSSQDIVKPVNLRFFWAMISFKKLPAALLVYPI